MSAEQGSPAPGLGGHASEEEYRAAYEAAFPGMPVHMGDAESWRRIRAAVDAAFALRDGAGVAAGRRLGAARQVEAQWVTRDEALLRSVEAMLAADELVGGGTLDAVRLEGHLSVSYGWAMVADRLPPAAGDGR